MRRRVNMIVYGIKTCNTCRKALKSLPGARLHDIRAEGLPAKVAEAALARFGGALVNRKSATWRGLSAAERAAAKRPLIDVEGTLYLGWGRDVQAALLG